MRVVDFFDRLLGNRKEITLLTQRMDEKYYSLAIEDFAIQVAINLIAGIISKCEFKTMVNGKQVKDDEYYLWNYQPNVNQNGTDFIAELISKLIYYNEALIVEVNGQLIIADDFHKKPYAVLENEYTNVRRGELTFNKKFYEKDVMYFHYAHSNIRALLSNILNGYMEIIDLSFKKYKRAGGRKGVMELDITPSNTEEWHKALTDLYGNRFKSYFNNENALVVLPRGMKYTEMQASGNQKSTSDVTDIVNLTKEAFVKVAQAVRIPASLLIGDVANLDSAIDEALTTGILPLVDLLEGEIIRKRYGKEYFKKGYGLKIDTTAIKHFDLMDIATNAEKIIGCGLYNIDDLCEHIGTVPYNTWWSKRHYMSLNFAAIEAMEEGKEPKNDKSDELSS